MTQADFFDLIVANVKRERKARRVSQLELALILGHQSASYVGRIELRQKNSNYSLKHLFLIAKEFDIDIHDLISSTK